jgi:hypothetical protein
MMDDELCQYLSWQSIYGRMLVFPIKFRCAAARDNQLLHWNDFINGNTQTKIY